MTQQNFDQFVASQQASMTSIRFPEVQPLFQNFLASQVQAHTTEGKEWPADAEFALVSRFSTWPIGWSDIRHVDFFGSRAELDAKIAELCEWARLEDNHVAYQGYEWDWGPNKMAELAYSSGNL